MADPGLSQLLTMSLYMGWVLIMAVGELNRADNINSLSDTAERCGEHKRLS